MLKNRKNSISCIVLIIAAVIGLIILVVMMAIFGKETGKTAKILEKCESRGGECVDPENKENQCKGIVMPLIECIGDQVCCMQPP